MATNLDPDTYEAVQNYRRACKLTESPPDMYHIRSLLMTGPRATPPRRKTIDKYMRRYIFPTFISPGPHQDNSLPQFFDVREDKYLHSTARIRKNTVPLNQIATP